MKIEFLEKGKPEIIEKVLRSLPDWFGIEEATKAYINTSSKLPMFVAYEENSFVGFLSLKIHSEYAAEVYVMGVMPEFHRKGIGQALFEKAEGWLASKGIEFLQVKTLSEDRECDFYKKTRLFYQANGFRPLEVFSNLWDASNSCLLMVKSLKSL